MKKLKRKIIGFLVVVALLAGIIFGAAMFVGLHRRSTTYESKRWTNQSSLRRR